MSSSNPPKRKSKARCRPSELIHFLEDLQSVVAVVLYLRVSSHKQNWKGNLDSQEKNLRELMDSMGIEVVAVFRAEAFGWDCDRRELEEACRVAKEHGAIVLAETTDRFVRPRSYHSEKNPDAQPTPNNIDDLRISAQGVTLATHLHPDAPPAEVRAYQTRRGQRTKGRKGGRPKSRPGYKKEERMINLLKVRWMTIAGMSVREIAKCLGKHTTQIQRWKEMLQR